MTDASRKKQTFKLTSKKLILAVWVLILEEISAFRTLHSTGSDNEPIVGLKNPQRLQLSIKS